MTSTTYPASPTTVPSDLTGLSFGYTAKALLAIVSILLFFLLYLGLVVAAVYLFWLALTFEMNVIGFYPMLIKLGAIAGAGMLVVFTLKFFFKLRIPQPTNLVRLSREDHPELWNFVEQICREAGASTPKSIYVDPDVNAYVSYSNFWLSLFLPVKKDLTIGTGLLNVLTLSQFKGVIAHEFGHFAQSSMKIGAYIGTANNIIHGMIFERDSWDELLEKWKRADFRLSAAGLLLSLVISLIRQILRLFYLLLNILHSSLSREMEFNADKVAVKVAGSEAVVSALWNMEGGFALWNSMVSNAYLAAQKEMYCDNLYEQFALSQQRLEQSYRTAVEALPEDERGGRHYFATTEAPTVNMYASHPPNSLREANAKSPYIDCPVDLRSPWILFNNPADLQRELTRVVYREYLKKEPKQVVESKVFEQFIIDETTESGLKETFADTFANRFLTIPKVEEIEACAAWQMRTDEGLQWLQSKIGTLMEPVRRIEQELENVRAIAEGRSKEKKYILDGDRYNRKQLHFPFERLQLQLDEYVSGAFREWDTAFCAVYLKRAEQLGERSGLERLYDQYRAVAEVFKLLLEANGRLIHGVGQLQQQQEVSSLEIQHYHDMARQLVETVNSRIADLKKLDFVPLPNIETVEQLQNAVTTNGQFMMDHRSLFEEGRLDQLLSNLQQGIAHCRRLDAKCMTAMMQMHETLLQDLGEDEVNVEVEEEKGPVASE